MYRTDEQAMCTWKIFTAEKKLNEQWRRGKNTNTNLTTMKNFPYSNNNLKNNKMQHEPFITPQ
jgi:hypothetical protein